MKRRGAAVDIPIVTAAVAYDQPNTGQICILVYHQALWFGDDMDTNLINSNQMRMNGIIVNECPMHLSHSTPTNSMHTLTCPMITWVLPCICMASTHIFTPASQFKADMINAITL
jgi:hypothetical protein